MAFNKECLVMILDVRQNAAKGLKQKEVQCVVDILKEKICAAKKDFVSFVLLGTQRTHNEANMGVCNGSYRNIVQYSQPVVPSWNVLVDFMKFVTEPSCCEGDWLDALVVAMELLKNAEEICKFKRERILLFHDFDIEDIRYDEFDVITSNLLKYEVELIVISSNILYIDNAANGEPQPVFCSTKTKSDYQEQNEKYALRLVSDCNAKLYNFHEAFDNIMQVENARPMTWNQTLSIGSKICIKISAMIVIKDQSTIKLKKHWGSAEEEVTREIKYQIKDEEVHPQNDDLIDAYLLGATPVPFDEPLQSPNEHITPGLKFVGFVKRNSIPSEYHCGDSFHWIVHQKGMQASAKMLDALVKALLKTRMSLLCWKVYSQKFNNPKIVVLHPNELNDNQPASLSMVELAYHAQHHFWDFPKLRTQKNDSTKEQLDAIDNLIDSMDLMLEPSDKLQEGRETLQKDLLSFNTLPHVYEKCLLDMLERKVLCVAGEDDAYLQDLVAEKDYKEIFWRVPEVIEEKAKQAANKVKKLFPLEKNELPINRAKVIKKTTETANNNKNINNNKINAETTTKANLKKLERVGTITPAEDFEMLLKQDVLTLQDNTMRDAKFHFYAAQMRAVIWQLLFTTTMPIEDMDKIAEAIKVFRKCSYDFNAFADYNSWMRKLKAQIITQKLFDFWTQHIVKDDLGLCYVGLPSLEEQIDQKEFYQLPELENSSEHGEMNDSSIDELLASS